MSKLEVWTINRHKPQTGLEELPLSVLNKSLLERVEDMMNKDPIVASNARWHDAILTLDCDNEPWHFRVTDGRVLLVDDPEHVYVPRIYIQGTSENYQLILEGLPGGFHQAFRHKLLSFDGDHVVMMLLWKTIWRLGECLSKIEQV